MTAVLSDFLIIMISVSVFGCLFHLLTGTIRMLSGFSACQQYVFYKGMLVFYLIAPLFLTMVFIGSAKPEWVSTAGEDLTEWMVSDLPVAYRYYGYYRELDFIPYVVVLWFAGVVMFFSFRQLRGIFQLRQLRKNSRENQDCRLDGLCKKIQEEHQVRKSIKIYFSDVISSAFIAGIKSPVIFLPQESCSERFCENAKEVNNSLFTEEELEFILRHEIIHCSQRDIFYRVLLHIVKNLYWFNPFIYLFVQRFEDCSELACDEILLNREGRSKRHSYAQCILRYADNKIPLSHTAGINSGNIVEKRISAIAGMCSQGIKQKDPRLLLLVLCLFFAIFFLSFAGSMALRRMLGEWMELIYFQRID